MSEINKNVEQLRGMFKELQLSGHRIRKHPVSHYEEQVRNAYFDMLCVIAQYENADTENQLVFIQRIMAGAGRTMPIDVYVRRSQAVTVETMTDFIRQTKTSGLREIFIIDAMIISCADGTPNRKQVEFLAELADVMGMSKEKMRCAGTVTAAILRQDAGALKAAVREFDIDEYKEIFTAADCYIQPLLAPTISTEGRSLNLYTLRMTSVKKFGLEQTQGCYVIAHRNDATLENQLFEGLGLRLDCVNTVHLIGCRFTEVIHPVGVEVTGVRELLIEHCIFEDFSRNGFQFSSECNVTFRNCLFKDISYMLIKSENRNKILFEDCKFENIDRGSWPAISCGNHATARNCVFDNCGGGWLFSSNGTGVMENNTLINSGMEIG